MIEKYKALEAENERLKALNVELTAKCNWYNRDGARLERERDELTRQLSECKADAAKWRAHQKRKQEVIAAGMGRKILRDLYEPGKRDAVPEGFTLVPNEPTMPMLIELNEIAIIVAGLGHEDGPQRVLTDGYKAMLAAAPKGD